MFRESGYHQSGYTDLRVDNFNFHPSKVRSLQEASSFYLPGLGADWGGRSVITVSRRPWE